MSALPTVPRPPRHWLIVGGAIAALVVALIAGLLIVRQRQLAAQASAGVCGGSGNSTAGGAIIGPLPPGVTLPLTIPAGEPKIVATVNGDPIYAEGLELRVEGILANNRQMLQRMPLGSFPPQLQASLQKTPNQVRHDALTAMIQDCLLLQEGKRLGLTASLSAAQAMANQQLQLIQSLPASDPTRVSFENYLRINHLTEQTFVTDPLILQGYAESLTMAAVRQHIRAGLPAGESPTAGVNAYIQHLWQTGNVRAYLPAQLGW